MTTARKLKVTGVIVLISLIVIIVLQNTETVTTRMLFTDVAMPMAVLLFVNLAVGFLLGFLVFARMASKDRKKAKQEEATADAAAPPPNTP